MKNALFLLLLAPLLCACHVTRNTVPGRSATEEMVISAATDKAADQLAAQLTAGGSVYIDSTNFDQPDGKYALGAIRAAIAKRGTKLAADRSKADRIVEVRAGALSIDQNKFLIGIPEFSLPIPLAGEATVPEIAFYSFHDNQGVAKFAAAEFTQPDGLLVAAPDPIYAYSHDEKRTVMLFISWSHEDFLDEKDKDPEDRK
jgi:hypothetical protein